MKKEVQDKRGIALIMALWIMTILLTVAASFAFMMRMELRLANNSYHAAQARYLASAGIDAAIAKLREDTLDSDPNYIETDSLHESWFTYFSENFACDTSAAECPMSWDDKWFFFGKGGYSVHLVDESSMMNINVDYGELVSSLESLYFLLGGNVAAEQKAVNIKDYRDSDPDSTTYLTRSGNETDVKDYDFDTIREIQKVMDINVGENPLASHACDLSIYSKDKNHCMDRDVTMTGTGVSDGERLNINTATAAQIIALPVDGLGTEVGDPPLSRAQHIVNYRTANGDFTRVGKVAETSGPGIIEVINEARMEQLADVIKVNDTDDEIKGTININTATYWSLRSYWLIGDLRATNIIKTRQGEIADKNGVTDSNYTYGKEASSTGRTGGHGRGEIVNTTEIGKLSFDDYSDFVTVRSDRFRIVSTGIVGTDGDGDGKIDPDDPDDTVIAERKIEATVDRHYHEDGTMGPITVLYWSEAVLEYD